MPEYFSRMRLGEVFVDRIVHVREKARVGSGDAIERGLFHRRRIDAAGDDRRIHRAIRHFDETHGLQIGAVLIEPRAGRDLAQTAERCDGNRLAVAFVQSSHLNSWRIIRHDRSPSGNPAIGQPVRYKHELPSLQRPRVCTRWCDEHEIQPAFVRLRERERVRRTDVDRSGSDGRCDRGSVRERHDLDVEPGFIEEAEIGGVVGDPADIDGHGADAQLARLLRGARGRREHGAQHARGNETNEGAEHHP